MGDIGKEINKQYIYEYEAAQLVQVKQYQLNELQSKKRTLLGKLQQLEVNVDKNNNNNNQNTNNTNNNQNNNNQNINNQNNNNENADDISLAIELKS